ncbi:MAG: hypothetical protein OHK0015_22600 [Chloroflexi bacterium OHK40]
MRYRRPVVPYRLAAALLAAVALVLSACAELEAALPPRPSPVPTLARLPTVTPVTPRPTPPPTATALATVTPTPLALVATVAVGANVRAGPGVGFAIVGVLDAGVTVGLAGRQGDWFQIDAPDGTRGWMAGQVLMIDPATNAAVPTATP